VPAPGDSARVAEPLLLPLALATSVLGVLGALAAHTLGRLVAWLTVASVGTILAAVGLYSPRPGRRRCTTCCNSTLVVAGPVPAGRTGGRAAR
jgi:multicomponent K+:H+ antiporter subunit D